MMEKHKFMELVPLWWFTVLSGISVGVMGAIAVLFVFVGFFDDWQVYISIGIGLAMGGLVISLFHLGKKTRFWRSLFGIKHSWLSREVVIAGLFTGVSLCLGTSVLLVKEIPWIRVFLSIITAILGILLLISIGLVYRLPSRSWWRGMDSVLALPLVISLLSLGVLFAFIPILAVILLFLLFWVGDGIFTVRRVVRFRRLVANRYCFLFPRLVSYLVVCHFMRLFLDVVVLVLFLCSSSLLVVVLSVIVFLDRFTFYAGMDGLEPISQMALLKAQRMAEAMANF